MSKLNHAAEVAMTEVLDLKKGEEVLIVTNFEGDVFQIAKELYEVTRKLGGKPVMVVQPMKTIYDFAERAQLAAMRSEPDICLALTAGKQGKDPYGQNIGYVGKDGKKHDHIYRLLMDGNKSMRGFWSPSVTVDMFERCVPIDYQAMRSNSAKLVSAFDGKKRVQVKAPAGTDITFSIEGRTAKADDGDFRTGGKGGNLPCGEAYISPAVGSAHGTIVFDGTVDLVPKAAIPKTPVKVVYTDGYVSKVSGGKEAKDLLKVIEKGEQMARERGLKAEEKNARHLGELGVGINYAAKMTANMLEDEKVGGTVHFAIGMNYDNDANALIHQDCLVKRPSMWIDDKQIMKDGKLLL